MNLVSATIPKTRLAFVNVPLVPVRTRAGETRYLCATWGGAMHLFDRAGTEKIIPYPEDTAGSYSFVPDLENGYAWAVHTGGKITRIDVDAGKIDFVQDIPLSNLNWSAALTPDGRLVCAAHPGDVMVYDVHRREVVDMFTPISTANTKGRCVCAPDGRMVIPMLNPGAELILLDPRTGAQESVLVLDDTAYTFPRAFTFLPDGRIALPRTTQVDTLTYPGFAAGPILAYPEPGEEWRSFRDTADGRLYAWSGEERPLYRLTDACEWEVYLERFSTTFHRHELDMFSVLPNRGLLALTRFGLLLEYDSRGAQSAIAQLDNLGRQRISALAPGAGDQVFTSTFINSSFQEVDYRTGRARNITPCQAKGGQVNNLLWFGERLWLAAYGGAEINVYDPNGGGAWPENPRPAVLIGEDQMRPLALETDGHSLWCVTHAKYGLLDGALTRVDPVTLKHKVWRGLVPQSNPTSLALHDGMVYVGTTIHRDQRAGPPGPVPGAVVAFDAARERVAWTARPVADAEAVQVVGVLDDHLLAIAFMPEMETLLRLDLDGGELLQAAALGFDRQGGPWSFFIGGGRLCAALPDGVFLYDLALGVGERLVPGPVSPGPTPVSRGDDLFYIREHEVAVAEGLWESLRLEGTHS